MLMSTSTVECRCPTFAASSDKEAVVPSPECWSQDQSHSPLLLKARHTLLKLKLKLKGN